METSEAPLSVQKNELVDAKVISNKHDLEGVVATESTVSKLRMENEKIRDDIKQTEEHLAKRSNSVLHKLKNVLGVEDKQALSIQDKIESLKKSQGELPDADKLIESYYEKMQKLPLTNQEKRELLKPEVLADLSMSEYITLWRRLNPHFLSHITRQGFRDHSGMAYHTAGLQEFQNGFLDIVEDSKMLRPPLALQGLKTRDESTVKEYLGDWVLQAENETEAEKRLNDLLNFSLAEAPKYPDKTAVHFAGQTVANEFYGGERSNEVFFIYPADVLASQHNFAFNWDGGNFSKPAAAGERQWNDIFVWPETLDNPGISVDAGVVFLPESTLVDPNTGSKYAMETKVVDGEERRVMVEDTALINSFLEWAKGVNENSPVKQAFREYKKEDVYKYQKSARRECLTVFAKELEEVGFAADTAWALGYELVGDLHWRDSFSDPEILEDLIKKSGANWKTAENTISAKDYWENYFAKNPNLRPSHIQYYDEDPNTAIYRFQQENGIGEVNTSKTEGDLLGFDDRNIDLKSKTEVQNTKAMRGYDELVSVSHKIISEHFKSI